MSCRDVLDHLYDYCDDLLVEPKKVEVSLHLDRCPACREELARRRAILDAMAALPKSIPPERDLWPLIAARLDPSPRRSGDLTRHRSRGTSPASPAGRTQTAVNARGRRQRWVLGGALATAVLVLSAASVWLMRGSSPPIWQVARLEGTLRVGSEPVSRPGGVPTGEWLETDDRSRAMLSAPSVGHVEIDPKTRIRVLKAGDREHRLQLARGTLHAMIWAPPKLFFVETPSAVAIDLGCAYTLEVDDDGQGLLRVTAGWVAMQLNERQAIVPAGALCETRPGVGPGTPYYEDASEALRTALRRLDFEAGGSEALRVVLAESRQRDALTLWHLLPRVKEADRPRLYDRLASLVPPPEGVSRDQVLRLDPGMLDLWRGRLQLPWF